MSKWRRVGESAAILAVIATLTVVIGFWLAQAPSQGRSVPRTTVDFTQFYTLGYAVARPAERHALESQTAWKALSARLAPGRGQYARVYGPQLGLLFAPLSHLTLFTAYLVWNLISLAAFGTCVGWLVRRQAPNLAPLHFWIVAGTLAFPPFAYLLLLGHVSVLAVVALAIAVRGLALRRAWLTRIGIGLLAYKPTLFVPVLLIAIGAREFAAALAAIAVAAATLLMTVPVLGLAPLEAYIETLLAFSRTPGELAKPGFMCSLRTFWELVLPSDWAAGVYAATAAATLLGAAWGWRRIADPLQRIGIAAVATVLATPHLYYYDLVIISPAIVAAADGIVARSPRRTWFHGLTWAAYFALATAPLVVFFPVLLPTLIFAAWFVAMLAAWQPHRPMTGSARGVQWSAV